MPRGPRQQRLNVFLLKEGVDRDRAIRGQEDLDAYVLDGVGVEGENLFVKPTSFSTPKWAGLLGPHVTGGLPALQNASTSAVLLVSAEERLLALTFGHGRHLIDPEAIVQDFGLRVVLNTVAYDQIKSVDARTVDELTLHTRRDVSRDSSFTAFGLDISTDLLRAVTGTTTHEGLAGRLTGADALALNSRAQVPEFPGLCTRLLAAYRESTYKEHFDFIDHLRPERDPAVVATLDALLLDALRSREIDNLHLAVPEPLSWLDVAGFTFSNQLGEDERELDADPRISVYLRLRDAATVTLDQLKADRVQAMRAEDDTLMLGAWPVYRCVVFEVQHDGELYTLSAGQWYRVSLDFKQQVYDAVNALPPLQLDLPEAPSGSTEAQYIERAVAALDAVSLDQRLARTSVPDPIEVCDILTRERSLLHLKKRGSSSTLSHLFAQGLASAELLLESAPFRAEARQIAADADPSFAETLPADRPAAGDYEVGYVVITRSSRTDAPLTLPFFSLVSLRAAARRLQGFGFRVGVAAVSEPPPSAAKGD